MQQPHDPELLNAIRDYLRSHAERRGQQQTAERFGVSRYTLWRFLWKDHVSPRLVAAVTADVGDSIGRLRWATTRLNDTGAQRQSGAAQRRLTPADTETLEIICHTPLASVDELSAFIRLPANTIRERLARLSNRGLAESRAHRLQVLGARPQKRFFPTRDGIVAAAGSESGCARLLGLYPVSRQWFRVLAERLDSVALLYQVAAMIAELRADESPLPVEHCRSGPYDLLLRMGGGSIGLVRQGPMLSHASLRYRIRTIERMDVSQRPLVTLILVDSEQDMRRVLRTIADPSVHRQTFVAVMGEVMVGKGKCEVWQQGGYGFASTPTLEPDVSLSSIVKYVRRLGEAYPEISGSRKRRSSNATRVSLADTTARLDQALSLTLGRADKRVLDLLAGWPFCSAEQLAGLMEGVSKRQANHVLRSLLDQGLVQHEELGNVLSDKGLTYLARRDRSAVGPTLDRWTPLRDEQGYIGSALQTMANQHRHQSGITEFCAMLSAETGQSPDHEILDLLSTHRSQISYEHSGTRYLIFPDASFQLRTGDDWHWCLLEFERRATTPKRVPERLRAYRRYFESDYIRPDHSGQLPLVLFVFETEQAETTFLDTAERVSPAPFLSTHLGALSEHGILGRSWRAWGATSHGRHRLQQFGLFLNSPTTRAEHFL